MGVSPWRRTQYVLIKTRMLGLFPSSYCLPFPPFLIAHQSPHWLPGAQEEIGVILSKLGPPRAKRRVAWWW